MERTMRPETWSEVDTLNTLLDYSRATVRAKCEGLSDEDAARPLIATSPLMTVKGLVHHLRWVETWWFEAVFLGADLEFPWTDEEPDREMSLALDRPLAELLDEYDAVCARSRELIAGRDWDELAQRGGPKGPAALRWIVAHMLEETSRHCGHLDLIRELTDGATGQ
ncbi:hypothetical protein Afil01_20410 [Actinorhabdospora filicis]|uniref:Mini-circle protein n=1 Tax=Actinorhabdospora filicis TaxID=1785913 RepID=A0A9W6SHI2_9ACTN|nr:DinB family protein [Actinorhabdospora filicis]GLZ77234.1 hypothetical protein Afil01_20410 [Actinorhabdospora filicis]